MFEHAKFHLARLIPLRWQAMIEYSFYLYEGSIHAPHLPLPYSWHDGGDTSTLFFGTFETSLTALNFALIEPSFAIEQVYNILSLQQENGFIPARLSFDANLNTRPSRLSGPILWPWAIQAIHQNGFDIERLEYFFGALHKQVEWFEQNRKSQYGGFYFIDIYDGFEESCVGLELRFLPQSNDEPLSHDCCIDASCQLYAAYDILGKWANALGENASGYYEKANQLRAFIQQRLFCPRTHFFYDSWHLNSLTVQPPISVLGLWPLFTRAANPDQVATILKDYLINSSHFYGPHPICTLSQSHPSFSPVGWLGPVRNSQLLFLSLGLKGYGLEPLLAHLLEKALDQTCDHFHRTHTLWEFYHPQGGHPQEMIKLAGDSLETPNPQHVIHNPLFALAMSVKRVR